MFSYIFTVVTVVVNFFIKKIVKMFAGNFFGSCGKLECVMLLKVVLVCVSFTGIYGQLEIEPGKMN